jgi:two-component system phosphate regulon sensor histidine kinase PhoR
MDDAGQLPDLVDEITGALPGPVLLLDGAGRVERANPPAIAVLGDWVIGRSYVSVLRQPEILTPVEAAFYDGKAGEADFTHADGAVDTLYRVHIRPLKGPVGAGKVLLHFEDISEQSQARSFRRGFVANVSHELKTPLTALMGFIETLQGPARNDVPAQEHFLGLMAREAKRMNRLVSDLLSLSRVEAQERARPEKREDLVTLISIALEPLSDLAREAGVTVTLDLPAQAIVRADADQMIQVVTNLTENAVKYGGKTVHLALRSVAHDGQLRGPAWQLLVQDDGPGIDPLHVPRLAERFYRVDDHRSRGQGGTGLGLAIVKHIAHRHRGRLKIESNFGQGSVFSVFIPQDLSRSETSP